MNNHIIAVAEIYTSRVCNPGGSSPGAPPRGWGRGIEASNPRGPGDFFSETPGDAGAILLHKFEDFWLFGSRILQILNEILDIIQFSES